MYTGTTFIAILERFLMLNISCKLKVSTNYWFSRKYTVYLVKVYWLQTFKSIFEIIFTPPLKPYYLCPKLMVNHWTKI